MYININLSENDKALIKSMKKTYKCEINIKPNEGYYFLQGESFQILSVFEFVMIKLAETDVKLSKQERKAICDGLDILKHYLKESEDKNERN